MEYGRLVTRANSPPVELFMVKKTKTNNKCELLNKKQNPLGFTSRAKTDSRFTAVFRNKEWLMCGVRRTKSSLAIDNTTDL